MCSVLGASSIQGFEQQQLGHNIENPNITILRADARHSVLRLAGLDGLCTRPFQKRRLSSTALKRDWQLVQHVVTNVGCL